MKTVEVFDLTDMVLDWAVAKAEGLNIVSDGNVYVINEARNPRWLGTRFTNCATYSPSTKWGDGGPIIERERIDIRYTRYARPENFPKDQHYWAEVWNTGNTQCGPTPLIAAMRCYVVSKLGDTIEVPDGLLED